MQHIRNFCIIAHIDHGKSTLADRLLELTHTVEERKMKEQLLDQMDLERERGITIKLQPVRMNYTHADMSYVLNLIDTPGHVDFHYEVSRSLQACEGALLVVDASQGIEAQTLANLYLAIEQNLTIIPIVNKIDLPAANVARVTQEIVHLLGCREEEVIAVSAKTGEHVEKILTAIIERILPPTGNIQAPLRALIFDSVFDDYQGVVTFVRLVDGVVHRDDKIQFMANHIGSSALHVGYFRPEWQEQDELRAGEIGYIITGLKTIADARVGDTVSPLNAKHISSLPGYRDVQPMVYAGLYAKDASQYSHLRDALGKLKLNDAALYYEHEHSPALGFGFRCGFLGMLHVDIVQERLKREFDLDLIITTPSVAYRVTLLTQEVLTLSSPISFPDPSHIARIEEPIMNVDIVTPTTVIGNIMQLVSSKRGKPSASAMEYLDDSRVILHYQIPLSGIIVDFYDQLKNVSSGYASLNYEFFGYADADIVRLDIIVAEERVDALASMVYRDIAQTVGRAIVQKLKNLLPRQLFEVKLQAALGGKVVAAERIPALRKDVTAKLYGGDVTRKRKLLEKQKKGKKRMRTIGKVDIPQEAFFAILRHE